MRSKETLILIKPLGTNLWIPIFKFIFGLRRFLLLQHLPLNTQDQNTIQYRMNAYESFELNIIKNIPAN